MLLADATLRHRCGRKNNKGVRLLFPLFCYPVKESDPLYAVTPRFGDSVQPRLFENSKAAHSAKVRLQASPKDEPVQTMPIAHSMPLSLSKDCRQVLKVLFPSCPA